MNCSECCSGHALSDEASCKDGEGSKVLNTESDKTESKICEEKGDGKKEEAKDGEAINGHVKSEGDDWEKSGKEKEVIVLDDSLDDFKPAKKRFRTPTANAKDRPVSH